MESNTYETVTQALADLQRRGFTATFKPEKTFFRCNESGEEISPREMTIVEHHRFEGKTDPQDMSVVYAIETHVGLRGTIVDAFGAYADPAISALLSDVAVHEANDHKSAPGGWGNQIQPGTTRRTEGQQGTGPSTRD